FCLILTPDSLWVKRVHGDLCVKCGARRVYGDVRILGISSQKSNELSLTGLTMVRSNYVGPCQHDWAFTFYNRTSLLGDKLFADGLPQYRFPACASPDVIANAIEKLPTAEAKMAALEAIGSRTNLLRWLAASELTSLSLNYATETNETSIAE